MPDDQDRPKDDLTPLEAGDDSTAEMEIIKGLFSGEEQKAAGEPNFAMDLFSEPKPAPAPAQAPSPPLPPEIKPAAPAPKEKAKEISQPTSSKPGAPTPNLPLVIPQPPEKPASPPPPAAPEAAPQPAPQTPVTESIKIVTDDDLKSLFESSSPGIPPAGPRVPVPAPPAPPEPAPPAPEKAPEAGPEKVSSPPAPAEVPPTPAKSPEAAEEKPAAGAERGTFDDISPDEIIDQLETRAEVGEMTSVAAGKKGRLLEKTAELISGLEPAGGDLVNATELKKLFNNVNILIQLARETAERLRRLEEAMKDHLQDEDD